MTPAPRLYRRRAAALYLGISPDRLARMSCDGTGPAFHKPVGSHFVFYTQEALDRWLGAALTSTTQAKARDRELAAAVG